ncbi:MAG: orotate phosphoribosyltransferase [Limnochordia bacterium]
MSDEVRDLFLQTGALLSGHFVLTSGLHSDTYLEKFAALQYPDLTQKLCDMIAARFADDRVQVVVGPATGGILLAHGVGKVLGTRAIFSEREDGRMTFRRGFAIAPGERVLIVEDVVTTGGSVLEVLNLVKDCEGDIVGVGYLVDRSGGKAEFGVRAEPLMRLEAQAWSADQCPLCAANQPFTSRGSRHLHH